MKEMATEDDEKLVCYTLVLIICQIIVLSIVVVTVGMCGQSFGCRFRHKIKILFLAICVVRTWKSDQYLSNGSCFCIYVPPQAVQLVSDPLYFQQLNISLDVIVTFIYCPSCVTGVVTCGCFSWPGLITETYISCIHRHTCPYCMHMKY